MAGRTATTLRWLYGAGWLAVALWLLFYLLVYALYAYAILRFPFDYDQGEGYDVNSAWALVQGFPLYASPDEYPFYSSNYPPLYSLLLAPLVGAFGPKLALGRLLSLAAVALVVFLIALAVRQDTGRWRPALAAGLLFLASPYVYHVTPLARVNALMLALGLAGVYVLGRAADAKPRASWVRLLAGGGLLLAALYTKQMALDAAGAALLYLTLRDHRRGLLLSAAVLAVGGVLYLALDWATAGGFTLNVLWANANPFSWAQAAAYYRNFLEIHPLLAATAAAWTLAELLRGGPRGLSVYALYFLAALGVALGTGKWGAGESYFLAALAAACILCGRALGRVEAHLGHALAVGRPAGAPRRSLLTGGALAVLVLALLSAQLRLLWHGPWSWPAWGAYDRGLQASVLGHLPTAADRAAGLRVVDYLARATGDVLAEEAAFALVAGRRVLGNATQQRNLYEARLHDPAKLVSALERHEVGVVVLNGQQYPPPVLTAIGQNYYLVEVVEMNGFRYLVLLPGGR